MQILENDLRKAALEKHAAESINATPERKQQIMKEIDRDIRKELRRRMTIFGPDAWPY